jgi:hypothetical protein
LVGNPPAVSLAPFRKFTVKGQVLANEVLKDL